MAGDHSQPLRGESKEIGPVNAAESLSHLPSSQELKKGLREELVLLLRGFDTIFSHDLGDTR